MSKDYHTHRQGSAYESPWTLSQRLRQFVWEYAWPLLCGWTPKPLNPWRLFVLRRFGATLEGTPFVHQRARIQQPWKLTMKHRACLGDRANAYTLGEICLEEGVTIAQEVYLCTGTHDFSQQDIPLQTAPIHIEANTFVGARAFILPGVRIGKDCVVGAASVVTKDIPDNSIIVGNPARIIAKRDADSR